MKTLFDLPVCHPAEFTCAEQPLASTAWTEQIFGGPCILYGLIIRPDGNAATVAVIDGQGAGDRLYGTFLTLATRSLREHVSCGVFFRHGLFISCDTHVLEVTLAYLPVYD